MAAVGAVATAVVVGGGGMISFNQNHVTNKTYERLDNMNAFYPRL